MDDATKTGNGAGTGKDVVMGVSESLPTNEVPERRRPSKHWVVLGLLVIVHAALGTLIHWQPLVDSRIRLLLVVGFISSQPLLLALWTAFAPQRFYQRALWGLLLCALVAFCVELGTLSDRIRPLGFYMSMDLILFLVGTAILLLVRRFFRWKLAQSAAGPITSHYQPGQFGIKHLFILMAITAVVCGLFRALPIIEPLLSPLSVDKLVEIDGVNIPQSTFTPAIPRDSLDKSLGDIVTCGYHNASVLLPLALVPWFTLGYHRNALLSIFWSVVLLGVGEMGCYFVIRNISDLDTVLLIQLGGGCTVLITTLVLRCCGFRMIREPKI